MPDVVLLLDLEAITPTSTTQVRDPDSGNITSITSNFSFAKYTATFTRDANGFITNVAYSVGPP